MHFLKTKLTSWRIFLRNYYLQFYRIYSGLYERTVYSIPYKCASKQAMKICFSVEVKVTLIFKVACLARLQFVSFLARFSIADFKSSVDEHFN
jgi:hypothetical protein